jgi:PAS domain S-box-containing protein
MAKEKLEPALDALRSDFADASKISIVAQIEEASRQKIAFSEMVIALRKEGNIEQATVMVAAGSGRATMDQIRALVGQLRESERAELRALLQADSSKGWWAQPFSLIVQALLLLLLAGAYAAYLANVRRLERTSLLAQESSARQVALFEASTDAMIVVDETGNIENSNPAARRLFNLTAEEMIGEAAPTLFKGQVGLEPLREQDDDTILQGGEFVQHLIGICQDGASFDAEVSSSTVRINERRLTLLVVRDSTERNRVESMKSQFVSTVSHELRTPLTSIRGALSLLDHAIGDKMEAKPRQLLSIAKSNSERLSKLIDDILDVEKLGAGNLRFHYEHVDLRKVVSLAEESNRTYAADRGVRLKALLPDKPLPVEVDLGRILQALTNLISNAAKFSPTDGLVSIVAESQDGIARVSVEDNGPGIPVEFRPQLFERFSQARGSQQSSNAGTGLGLAITKSIVEQHEGKLCYETLMGKGSRFWIELPIVSEREQ